MKVNVLTLAFFDKMKQINFKNVLILLFATFIIGCSDGTPMPKPIGYNRIERESSADSLIETPYFRFSYSQETQIDSLISENKEAIWFNIVYPQYRARLYCTFSPINKSTLKQALEDNHRFVYSHTIKADDITKLIYENPDNKTYGTMYEIAGNVATPIQFFLTDSTAHFFRASLYYDTKVNEDSVMPVTGFIKEDITKMIESFEWK